MNLNLKESPELMLWVHFVSIPDKISSYGLFVNAMYVASKHMIYVCWGLTFYGIPHFTSKHI